VLTVADLGHLFNDGPTSTGQRYLNSVSIDFKKNKNNGFIWTQMIGRKLEPILIKYKGRKHPLNYDNLYSF
jgi:hypothetical protein